MGCWHQEVQECKHHGCLSFEHAKNGLWQNAKRVLTYLPFPSTSFSRTRSLLPPPKGAPLDLSEAANTPRPTHQPPWSSSRDPNADKSAGGASARWISISSLPLFHTMLPSPAFPARSHTGQGRPARMGCCSTTSWREGGRVTAQRPPEGHGDPQQPTVARVVACTPGRGVANYSSQPVPEEHAPRASDGGCPSERGEGNEGTECIKPIGEGVLFLVQVFLVALKCL